MDIVSKHTALKNKDLKASNHKEMTVFEEICLP